MAKRNKEVSEENSPFSTSEKQLNKFSRRSLKLTVCIIMLVDIASYNVPDEILLMAEFIFSSVEEICVSLALYVTDYMYSV